MVDGGITANAFHIVICLKIQRERNAPVFFVLEESFVPDIMALAVIECIIGWRYEIKQRIFKAIRVDSNDGIGTLDSTFYVSSAFIRMVQN